MSSDAAVGGGVMKEESLTINQKRDNPDGSSSMVSQSIMDDPNHPKLPGHFRRNATTAYVTVCCISVCGRLICAYVLCIDLQRVLEELQRLVWPRVFAAVVRESPAGQGPGGACEELQHPGHYPEEPI